MEFNMKRQLNEAFNLDTALANASSVTLNLIHQSSNLESPLPSQPPFNGQLSLLNPQLKKRHSSSENVRIISSNVSSTQQIMAQRRISNGDTIKETGTQVISNHGDWATPHDLFMTLLHQQGVKARVFEWSAPELEDYFVKPTQHDLDSYSPEAVGALRSQDLTTLRTLLKSNFSMQCCNRFGEGLVHMACRRGYTEVVKFLLHEAHVTLCVKDDYGRTPAHDACWTCTPEFELMKIILEKCPELLLVSDKRGHTPLQYIRREHAEQWCEFLIQNQHLLEPKHEAFLNVLITDQQLNDCDATTKANN